MKKYLVWALLVAASTGAVGRVAAQDAQIRAEQLAGIDASIRASVIALADSARIAGAPAEVILDAAREGSMKGYPPARIVAALEGRLNSLRRSRAILGPASTGEDIAAGATALRAGFDSAAIAYIHAERGGEPLFVSYSLMANLAGAGVPVDSASDIVVLMIAAGVRNSHLAVYEEAVRGDILRGALPAAAASARAEATILQRATRPLDGVRGSAGSLPIKRPPPASSIRP